MSETWKPIETAPRDGTLVLLGRIDDPDWPLRCRRWQGGHWRGWDAEDATHWQSLPTQPTKALVAATVRQAIREESELDKMVKEAADRITVDMQQILGPEETGINPRGED